MAYYLTCFAFSSFLFWFGQKVKRNQNWFIYGIALLIPAILAGIRDVSVGIDVLYYAYPIFEDARLAPSIHSLIYTWERIEIGYLWLNFVLSRITSHHNLVLFTIMFIELFFVFLALRQWRDKIPIWLGMSVFYFLFFNMSLNLMRQCLALAIAFFGMKYVFKRKFFHFTFWILLGFLFHRSTLILLLYYPLFWYANKFTSRKSILLLAVSFSSLIIFSDQIVANILYSLDGVIPYAKNIASYIRQWEKGGLPYSSFVYYGLLAILFLFNQRKILSNFPDTGYFLRIVIILSAIHPLLYTVGSDYIGRFSLFITWWLYFLIPIIFYSFNKFFCKSISNGMILSYSFIHWYTIFIYNNASETADYSIGVF
jgi:hypothetical protein